jgi:hypothetical protein
LTCEGLTGEALAECLVNAEYSRFMHPDSPIETKLIWLLITATFAGLVAMPLLVPIPTPHEPATNQTAAPCPRAILAGWHLLGLVTVCHVAYRMANPSFDGGTQGLSFLFAAFLYLPSLLMFGRRAFNGL